jgi:hypothetical protein
MLPVEGWTTNPKDLYSVFWVYEVRWRMGVGILDDDHDDHNDHVDGVRLHLWSATINGPIVHPPGDMTMKSHGWMIWTGENSWFVHHSSLGLLQAVVSSSKAEGNGEGNDEFCLMKHLFHTSKEFLTCSKILWHWGGGGALRPRWKESVLEISIALINPSTSAGSGPANPEPNGKHANH